MALRDAISGPVDPLICCVGDLVEDVIVRLEVPARAGADVPGSVTRHRGGSAANTAAAVVHLGGRARFVGQVGADEIGDRLLGDLRGLGVDCVGPRRGVTGTVVVVVEPSGERTMFSDPRAAADLAVCDEQWLDGAAALHVPYYSLARTAAPSVVRTLIDAARHRGLLVSLDPASVTLIDDRFLDLVRTVHPDVLLCNAAEAAALGVGAKGLKGAHLVVVKQGAEPALLRGTTTADVPVPQLIGAVDSTGAGARSRRVSSSRSRTVPIRRRGRSGSPSGRERRARFRRGCVGVRMSVVVAPEVRDALAARQPVVALESTIFSPFGLPAPANAEAPRSVRCRGAGRGRRARAHRGPRRPSPGRPRSAASTSEFSPGAARWRSETCRSRSALDVAVGVTTVSAALALAAAAGVSVFATGGIGGVHREAERTSDVSADLGALAAHSLVTVSAGAKAFLDLPRTLEHLEMLGVPVLGWRTDEFPMFWCTSSGLPVPHRVDEEAQVAAVLRADRALGLTGGVLLSVPIPAEAAIDRAEIEAVIASAVATAGATGAAVTPHVLAAIGRETGGRTVPANLALAEHNATVAAAVASELARDETTP